MKPKILVTSATGHVGTATVNELLKCNYPVRAFVRKLDSRAAELSTRGAEIFEGDIRDYRDVQAALTGCQRAFHNPPFSPNTLYDSTLFAVAAEEAKLEVVTLMGAWNLSPTHPSIHQRGHWLAHNIYRWMPSVDVIHLAPGLFAFPYFLGLPAVVHFGQLLAPFGQGRNAPPANEDIGRVAAHSLMHPAPHIGKSYRPTGPELLTPEDIAGIFSSILERRVQYKSVSFKQFHKAAIALGLPTEQVAHIRYYAEEVRNDVYAVSAPNDHVEIVTGAPAESFEVTARRYIQKPALVSPNLKIGSKLSAFSLLARIMMARPFDLQQWERDRGYPLIRRPTLAHECSLWRESSDGGRINIPEHIPSAVTTSSRHELPLQATISKGANAPVAKLVNEG